MLCNPLVIQDSMSIINEIQNKYLMKNDITKEEIEELINKRLELKKLSNYEEADKIRTYLLRKGITLNDINNVTEYDIVFRK